MLDVTGAAPLRPNVRRHSHAPYGIRIENQVSEVYYDVGGVCFRQNTSLQFVREMDGEFWACGLNEDDRFSDLLMDLDMFGVPREDFGSDEKTLASQCRYALRLL